MASSSSSSSISFIPERPSDQAANSQNEEYFPTESEQISLSIAGRTTGAISLVFAFYLIWTVVSSKYYRRRIFHRLMVGCAANIVVLSVNRLWGQAAVPENTPGFPLARGTQATCTTQGFITNMAMVIPLYYMALSILCYVAFQQKFQLSKKTLKYMEVSIHLGVYILPLATSSFLLSQEAYNPSWSECTYGSYPVGCGDQSSNGTVCERGPQNFGDIARWLGGLQIGICFLFPTLIMAILYFKVRLLQGPQGKQIAYSVAVQASLYLLALYWTYIPKFIFWGVTYKGDQYAFGVHLLNKIIEGLQGVWFCMAYYYFRSDPIQKLSSSANDVVAGDDGVGFGACDIALSCSERTVEESAPRQQNVMNKGNGGKNKADRSGGDTMMGRPSFSIFDGFDGAVDPESPWAKYLYDNGEDDSYQGDCGEHESTAFTSNQI